MKAIQQQYQFVVDFLEPPGVSHGGSRRDRAVRNEPMTPTLDRYDAVAGGAGAGIYTEDQHGNTDW